MMLLARIVLVGLSAVVAFDYMASDGHVQSWPFEKVCDITDFGAVAGGTHDNAKAISAAVVACSKAGGGIVNVPQVNGTTTVFMTSPFHLLGNICLSLDAHVTLLGNPDPNKWVVNGEKQSMVMGAEDGSNISNVVLMGRSQDTSIIDGNGEKIRKKTHTSMLKLSAIRGLTVFGFQATNPASFTVVPYQSTHIWVHDMYVNSYDNGEQHMNGDGVDPMESTNVLIENTRLDTSDDCIAVKSGSANILVRNVTCVHGHGFSVGADTHAGIHNITFRNCSCDKPDNCIRVKTKSPTGTVTDITYEDIRMKNPGVGITIDQGYHATSQPSLFENVTFRAITGHAHTAFAILCKSDACKSIVISDVDITAKDPSTCTGVKPPAIALHNVVPELQCS